MFITVQGAVQLLGQVSGERAGASGFYSQQSSECEKLVAFTQASCPGPGESVSLGFG